MLGFGPCRIRTLVSMATDSSHRLTMGKHKKKSSSQKPHGFHILCEAMSIGPFHKFCQPCPWGPYGPRPWGVMGKT